MELTEENVLKVLEELIPYIEADGGYLQLYDIEHETGSVSYTHLTLPTIYSV